MMAVRNTVQQTSLSSPATRLSSASFAFQAQLLTQQVIAHAHSISECFLLLMRTCCGYVLDHGCLDAGASIRLLDCSYFSFVCIQGYNQAWPHTSSYKCYMRILRVVYEIYTTWFDQSDFSIKFCYNYDLKLHT